MEIEANLLEKMINASPEFKRIHEKHNGLKQKVEALNKLKYLTPEQEVEKKQHQKEKLIMKDQMEKLLVEHEPNIQ
ncbi:MAG: hypothetical protein G3M78_10370 [Candidatus Nitrohelix vancouverensis]|uniref:DUF465 domain-containing protein n=1 Tax=Candidatus Nitrohelix vancouverensis TaxID=2705534 RepID=A0A7T0C3A7_9BACT|nr:MAG: hypothetical protein G3M78_10370 [Candidatus Nitrohelix vancouverensis]